ncbi:MAG TPA: DUF4389 domain-containing protein [Vicinamibacterales bacterium]|nr:DUF4389 domain-containing protein [Vicinamibacterales bacterium]
MPYPVSVDVQPLVAGRNRLTTAFRLFLAIPHLILVGGTTIGFASRNRDLSVGGEGGLLGAIAFFLAVVSWFTIVIAGVHILGIRQYTLFFLRWRTRALAYLMLLTDAYPPFGDAPYPASFAIEEPAQARDRVSVALRLFLLIPHLVILAFLMIGWGFASIGAWFVILFTGSYPSALVEFSVGAMRWRLRVEAYLLLLVDAYPPFSLT